MSLRNLGKEKAEVVDCQGLIGNNYRHFIPVAMSQKVFASVMAVYEAGYIKDELVFVGISSVHIAFNMFVVCHCAADNSLQGHKSE